MKKEISEEDSLISCYSDIKHFSFHSCTTEDQPQPESSLRAHPILGHWAQQEKAMSI